MANVVPAVTVKGRVTPHAANGEAEILDPVIEQTTGRRVSYGRPVPVLAALSIAVIVTSVL